MLICTGVTRYAESSCAELKHFCPFTYHAAASEFVAIASMRIFSGRQIMKIFFLLIFMLLTFRC